MAGCQINGGAGGAAAAVTVEAIPHREGLAVEAKVDPPSQHRGITTIKNGVQDGILLGRGPAAAVLYLRGKAWSDRARVLNIDITLLSGEATSADKDNAPGDMDVYYIVTDKCTECVGFHDEPQCAAVCPVDCCVDDPDHRESEEQLLAKKTFMHL